MPPKNMLYFIQVLKPLEGHTIMGVQEQHYGNPDVKDDRADALFIYTRKDGAHYCTMIAATYWDEDGYDHDAYVFSETIRMDDTPDMSRGPPPF